MQHADQLRVTTEFHDDVYVLHVAGEVDIASAPRLHEHLLAAMSAGRHRVVVDLSQATYLDSSGIAELAWAGKNLAHAGGSLGLTTGGSRVKRILDVVGISRLFPSRPDEEPSA